MISRRQLVDSFPLFSALLIEYGNAGQLWKMWTQHTAAGQNIWSWVSTLAAIVLWLLYYRFRLGKSVAYWVTWVAAVMLSAIVVTVFILQRT